jgi:hypothetical protein
MDFVVPIVIVALVIAALWYAAQPKCELLLSLDGGRLRVVRGKSTTAFLEAAQAICAEFGLTRGEIRGIRRSRHLMLAFSSSIPPEAQQRLRNVWQLHR